MSTPVVIDTDPGIDDAVAILLALASPEIRVLAVTTVGGNAGIERTTENARRLLHLAGRDEVPVGRGAALPLVRTWSRADSSVHGADGIGGIGLPPAAGPAARPAVEVLVAAIESEAEPVTVLAIGPLTNLATLAAAAPETFAKIGRIVLMGGGARVLGNVTPTAEFNVWFDPEAAARVFASGVPITMVGLDVTNRALTEPGDWDPLRGGGRISRALLAMVDYYSEFHRSRYGSPATAQHDALAAATILDPQVVALRPCFVDVECAGALTRGMTVVDVEGVLDTPANAQVALDLDLARFTSLLVGRIAALDAAVG